MLLSKSLDNAELDLLQQSWIMLEITVKQFSMPRAHLFFSFFIFESRFGCVDFSRCCLHRCYSYLFVNKLLPIRSFWCWAPHRDMNSSQAGCISHCHFELNPHSAVTLIFGKLIMLWYVGGLEFLWCGQWGSYRTDLLSTTECAALMP